MLSGRTLPEAVAPDGRPTAPPATSLRPQRRRRPTPAAGSAAPAAFMSPCADRARPLRLWAMAPRRACGRCRADRHDTEAAPASTAARGDGGAAGRTKHGSARGRRTGHRQRRGSLLRSPSAHAPESSTPWLHRRCGGGGWPVAATTSAGEAVAPVWAAAWRGREHETVAALRFIGGGACATSERAWADPIGSGCSGL